MDSRDETEIRRLVMKPILSLFALVLAISLVTACGQPDPVPMRVGTNVWPGYEPLYLARELGEYGDHEVRLVELPNTSAVMQAYRNGILDGAACTLDEALLLAQDQADFSILLIMDYSHGGDVILARPPISSLEEIRGKRVGLENTALGSYVISRALEIAGVGSDEITVVPVVADEQERAYDQQSVDAVVTFEPVRTRLLAKGANQIFDSRSIPKEIVDILIVRNSFLEERPDSVRKLLRGWFAALDRLSITPDEAHGIIARRLAITPQETKASYEGLLLPGLAENKAMLFGTSPPLLAIAKRLAENMTKAKILKNDGDPSRLFASEEVLGLYP
jgi:NitT/TauT family transport system substrate-binding protein